MKNNLKMIKGKKAQVIMEFSLCMFIIFLMIFALVKILRWTGIDLVERRRAHDKVLHQPIKEDYSYSAPWQGPLKQIDPYFYGSYSMNAVWKGAY